jgi:hypothetical protein
MLNAYLTPLPPPTQKRRQKFLSVFYMILYKNLILRPQSVIGSIHIGPIIEFHLSTREGCSSEFWMHAKLWPTILGF